jgi:hypothetical protein
MKIAGSPAACAADSPVRRANTCDCRHDHAALLGPGQAQTAALAAELPPARIGRQRPAPLRPCPSRSASSGARLRRSSRRRRPRSPDDPSSACSRRPPPSPTRCCAHRPSAADEVIAGKLDDHFPLVVWQTGSGTQTNMNANEVIANRAIELPAASSAARSPVHPNDDVNMASPPTTPSPRDAHRRREQEVNERLLPHMRALRDASRQEAAAFATSSRSAAPTCMDATPLTLGQEFSGYVAQLDQADRGASSRRCPASTSSPSAAPPSAPASTPTPLRRAVRHRSPTLTGLPFVTAPNKFAALAGHDALVGLHGALKTLAVR